MHNPGSYITDGISQEHRYAPSLNPHYFQVDERTVDDLLLFVTELSFEYNYFDPANKLRGNWLDFFLSDGNLMLRIFPYFDFKNYFLQYDRMKRELDILEDRTQLADKLKTLIEFIYEFLFFQNRMYDKFLSSIIGEDQNKLKEFTNIVGSNKDYEMARHSFYALSLYVDSKLSLNYNLKGLDLGSFVKSFGTLPGRKFEIDKNAGLYDNLKNFFTSTGTLPQTPYEFKDNLSLQHNIYNAIKDFNALFSKFEIMYNRLITASRYFLQKQKMENVSFKPHISLLLSFLDLYQLVKNEINQYTRKHLDFFYCRVLDIELKKAVADKVAVVLNLNKGVKEFLLEKGERMLATIPGRTTKEVFSLVEDTWVSQAEIKSLKTIFKSEYINFLDISEDQRPIKDFMIYAAENPVLHAASITGKRSEENVWPLFGEDQRYLPAGGKTMRETDMGLMVASALLFAVDGKRSFSIKFHLESANFKTFISHAQDYEMATGISKNVIISEMLKKAFVIDITGEDKWIPIPEYSPECPVDNGSDNYIDIRFVLMQDDPAVGIYNAEVHGKGYKLKVPAVRLMLNNSSFHNPYAFFHQLIIERVTIKVDVKYSTRVKLQNNLGQISLANPFQLFGPQPTLSSYLDIKNTNIFNRFTKDFKIKLKWFDIPKNKDGFKTFYEGYEPEITNDSFKIGLSGLINDNYLPKHQEQQLFDLFQMNKEPGRKQFLNDSTVIDKVDLHKIRFDNEPLLQEDEAAGYTLKNGAVRIELLEPAGSFGHKAYTSLFTDVIMQNAKWFARKKTAPNQPYIPIVQSVKLDYTLSHSEDVSGQNIENDHPDIEMWHIYPFGFKKTYPSETKAPLYFIPTIPNEGNLFIGLNNLSPGKVLTLLFQMEENNFIELEEHTNPFSWSYLDRNEWKAIEVSNILEDNTINFKGTGIIKMIIPENISKYNTLLDPDLYWFKITTDTFNGSRIRGIFTQVATARRELNASADPYVQLMIDSCSITEFGRKIPEIINLSQPYSSYHGSPAETKEQYYLRVSESLRHKQRLISSTDISQMILELFPEIHKVICFNNKDGKTTTAAHDDIKVIVIPIIKDYNNEKFTDPKVNVYTLYKIRNYLNANISPFLKLVVCNPDYERIKVSCNVIFKGVSKEISSGMLVQKLNLDIRKFISPWIFSGDADINTSNGIYPSEILNFIKNLPYIGFITGFNVIHFYSVFSRERGGKQARLIDTLNASPKEVKRSNKKLMFKASRTGAILISAETHSINVIEKSSKETMIKKEDEMQPQKTGIGRLSIGKEFLVMSPFDVSTYSGIQTNTGTEQDEEGIDFYYSSNL